MCNSARIATPLLTKFSSWNLAHNVRACWKKKKIALIKCFTNVWEQLSQVTLQENFRHWGGLANSWWQRASLLWSFRLQSLPGSTHHLMIVNPVHSKQTFCVYSWTCQSPMNGQNGVCSFILHNGCHTSVKWSCSAVKTKLRKPTPKLSTPLLNLRA